MKRVHRVIKKGLTVLLVNTSSGITLLFGYCRLSFNRE